MSNDYYETVVGYCNTYLAELQTEADTLVEKIDALVSSKVEDTNKTLVALEKQLLAAEKYRAKILGAREQLLKARPAHKDVMLGSDDPKTYWEYAAKLVADDDFRLDEAYRAEIERLAALLTTFELYQLNRFQDGECDPVILNCEVMDLWKELEAEGNTLLDEPPKDAADRRRIANEILKRRNPIENINR